MEDTSPSFNWQRQFFVTDHVKHKNGFTLYKIISIVFPKKNPEAGTKIVVWKRYSEFKSLHCELKRRHTKLHTGEEFPALIKSPFFHRFSSEIIDERKKFISLFLNFIAKSPCLFTADIFVKFFQNGYNISEYDGNNFILNDVSNFEVGCSIDSDLILPHSRSMGQVLNSEESKSSDESLDDVKFETTSQHFLRKFTKNDSRGKNRSSTTGECNRSHWKMIVDDSKPFPFSSKVDFRGSPDYWEEAVAHAEEAHEQEMLGQYEVSFAMYKTAIVCLLSGVQADTDVNRRAKVKELTSKYLQQAEWIYNNHLMLHRNSLTPKLTRIPRRSRSQLQRYKVLSILDNNLFVQDIVDNVFVVIKGVLKSSCPSDKSEVCVLPNDVSYLVKLLALHETETTVFFILEHIRHGKLWNHLEHYFNRGSLIENLDTEVTCASPRGKDESNDSDNCWDENSAASSASSGSTNNTNDRSLSRLESSAYTDAMSCESLSSHEENYFDLIEDYARAKSKKLKEIRDFNERRKRIVESIRPVKKTVSQVDLKSMEAKDYEQHRSHSLSHLAATAAPLPSPSHFACHFDSECFVGSCKLAYRRNRSHSGCLAVDSGDDDDDDNSVARYRRHSLNDGEKSASGDLSSVDIDTQQLLRNAQRLIESINETLSKNEVANDDSTDCIDTTSRRSPSRTTASTVSKENRLPKTPQTDDNCANIDADGNWQRVSRSSNITCSWTQADIINPSNQLEACQEYCLKKLDYNAGILLTPGSESVPSITEEYSITAIIQRNGVSGDMVKKWAAQILIALKSLHSSGVICRDLNPKNLLLADNGSIKLTYFYRYPNVDPPLDAEAKEKLYVAPEVDDTNCNLTFASDWWSFGAILYELTTLQTLHSNHPSGIHSHSVLHFPDRIRLETKSLLTELLRYDPNERLGSGICGADDVKTHPYFGDLNWRELGL